MGSSISFTVTAKVHIAVLPAASVAVQVTVVVPTGKKLPLGGTHEAVTPGQLSPIVGGANATIAPQLPGSLLAETLAGQEMVGFSVSLTVTVKVHIPILPAASVAVQVTVVVPTVKNDPLGGLQTTDKDDVQLSETVGALYVTEAPHIPAALLTVILLGQVTIGGLLSTGVTLKVHMVLLPEKSVAVNVTAVIVLITVPATGDCTKVATPQSSDTGTVRV